MDLVVAAGSAAAAIRVGESDCEVLRDHGFLSQPANALSSLAFVLAGAAIAQLSLRRVAPAQSLVFSACLVAVGLGSFAFHGPQPVGTRVLHDLPILLTILFMLLHDVNLLWPRVRPVLGWFTGGLIAATALTLFSIEAAGMVTAVILVGVVGCEVVIFRRRIRPVSGRSQRFLYGGIAAGLGFGALAWIGGRTDGPLCDPNTPLQVHGLWHVLAALVLFLWWLLALGMRPESSDAGALTKPARELG